MKLFVAGAEVTGSLGAEIRDAAARRAPERPSDWSPAHSRALALRDARDEADYYARYLVALAERTGLKTDAFTIPGKPGNLSAMLVTLKGFLWKLLRYQHDRMAIQQGHVNVLTARAFEFQCALLRKEVAELRARIDANGAPSP